MKTFKYITAAIAVSAAALAASAQENLPEGVYLEKNGLAYRKDAKLNADGSYTIDLEAFVTGKVTVENTSIPADIVLVLDVSGSMDDNMYEYIYTARSSQAYSYNSYGYNTYYYKHTDGKYYPVERGSYWEWAFLTTNTHYYLYYTVNGTNYYLFGNSVTTTRPTTPNADDPWFGSNPAAGQTIWTGTLYTQSQRSLGKKIDALKAAVKTFIDQIEHNDLYDDNNERRKDEHGNLTTLGNQISIVKYAMDAYYNSNVAWNSDSAPLAEGDHNQGGSNKYNYTEVVKQFTKTGTAANVTALKNAVQGLTASGATASEYGMNLARLLLKNLGADREGSTKTVVFFTDGSPTHGSEFTTSVATNTIKGAYAAKSTYKAKVFTIGVFSDLDDEEEEDVTDYMNYTSSNYPNAQSMSEPRQPNTDGVKYYQNSTGTDLSTIFKNIADISGGSGATDVTAESSVVVDVVASSFSLPSANPSDVTVLVAPCTGETASAIEYPDGTFKKYLTFGTAKTPEQYGLPHITPNIDAANKKVTTTGFDFSANWCGEDQENHNWHGYKQIIRFKIKVNDDVVGGPHVYTNDRESGIYVNGAQMAEFNRPYVKIPVTLIIQKQGLVGDDSAVFTIKRAKFISGVDPSTLTYESFTKIIMNAQNMDENNCVKLSGLDPDYYYQIAEDVWGWSYDYQDNGVKYTVGEGIQNPFVFINVPKEEIKEAEAVVRNIFYTKEGTKPANRQ